MIIKTVFKIPTNENVIETICEHIYHGGQTMLMVIQWGVGRCNLGSVQTREICLVQIANNTEHINR